MANDNFPRGLVPLTWPKITGNWYRVSTATDIFFGMPVDIGSDGYVAPTAVTGAATVVLGAAVAFAGTLKRGLATNDPFLDVSDLTPPSPSSDTGDRFVFVTDDPNQEYVIQGDTGGTLATLTAAGECVPLLYRTTSGNTDTGWANLEFDASGNVAQASGQVTLLRLHDTINSDGTENTAGTNYQKWVVKVTTSRKASGQVI